MKYSLLTNEKIDADLNKLIKLNLKPKEDTNLCDFYGKFYNEFNLGDKDTQPYTYWRKESAPIYAYSLLYRNVIAFLPPNNSESQLEEYFECKLDTLASFVNADLINIVIGDPSYYVNENGEPKGPYKDFFGKLKDDAGIAYSNIYEDAILNQCKNVLIPRINEQEEMISLGGFIRFSNYVEYIEKQKPFSNLPEKGNIKIPLNSNNPLIVKKPRNFVAERYCRLKLLETIDGSGSFSRKIEENAEKYTKGKVIEDIISSAYSYNYFVVPDFYSRGGFTTMDSGDMINLSNLVFDYSCEGSKACSTVTCLRNSFFSTKKEVQDIVINTQRVSHNKILNQMLGIKENSDTLYDKLNSYPAVWDNVFKKCNNLINDNEINIEEYIKEIDEYSNSYISTINELNDYRTEKLDTAVSLQKKTQYFTSSIIRSYDKVSTIIDLYKFVLEDAFPYLLPLSYIYDKLEKPISEKCGETAAKTYFKNKTGIPFNLWNIRKNKL